MTELVRLIDQASSDFERALLEAGIQHSSDPMRRAKVLAAIGVGTAAMVTSKSAAAAVLTWKKAVAGVAIAATGVGGVVTYVAVTAPSENSSVEQTAPERAPAQMKSSAPPKLSVEEVAPVEPEAEEVELFEEEEAPTPVKRQPRSKRVEKTQPVETTPVSARAADIQKEVAFLDGARAALRSGRHSVTLQRLGEYRTKFPAGSLGLEAEVLRIEALSASGRSAEASRRASRLLERSPNSVVAARLRRYVQD
jgi:hypothetical protein